MNADPQISTHNSSTAAASVRTFLIADVRGYTRFTQEYGDEAAGRLAVSFAALAREAVVSCGGEVIELRGDEALCVFESSRQALRAAVELQTRFRRRIEGSAAFPLPIGIGLDAGEAVPIEGGYRGGALNTASRLCGMAGPGQILATDTVASLARQLEGIRFRDRRPVRLKGLDKPVRVIEVLPEPPLPPAPELPGQTRPRITRRTIVPAAIACFALVAATVALVANRTLGRDFLPGLDANSVGVIDAKAARVEAQLEQSSVPSAIAAGGDYVWVVSEADGTVSRVDPETREVQKLALGKSVGGIAYGGGSAWVTEPDERAVIQVNPETLAVVQEFSVGNGPASVATGMGAVWVANTSDATISRIDLRRGVVTKPIPTAARPTGIAVGAGAVWVATEGGTVQRLDPRSGRAVGSVPVGNDPAGVAVGEGGVWVANRQDGTVSRIDTTTNSVSGAIRVGASPASVAVGGGAVWVANEGDETIARIDPSSSGVDRKLSLKSSPHALALARGKVWVTTLPSLPSRRGGVLRVESDPSECRCTDPARYSGVANLTDQNVITLSYDGLVAYRRVGGIAGGTLVGDLAVRVPPPTDAGRTYTFQLRPDIHYSNGAPVRASDFRHSLERALTVNHEYAQDFFGSIVGAGGCSTGRPAHCDLSKGIQSDDRTGTITIRLTEADPDFLRRLTYPLASVVPAGTPLRAARWRPIPGTGPYRVASFDPARSVRLVRNPHFRVWSSDARPDGYPDVVRFHLSDDDPARVDAVEKGRADWAEITGSVPYERVQSLLTQRARQLHSSPLPFSFFMFLNTRVPPFDDVRVRRALNYALDRARVRDFAGGLATRIRLSCQLLTPGVPGYRPYCPYTRDATPAGTWAARDMTKARALVAASGTRGTPVEVVLWKPAPPFVVKNARYYVSLLRELGYRSSLRALPVDFAAYGEYVADSRNRAQIGQWGFLADFLAPSTFLRLFSCSAFLPGTSASSNWSEFCDRGIDALMRRAATLQATDPARASELWADVDRALVDRGAAVFSNNPGLLTLVSERVGNYQGHPLWGTLLDQLWVK